jgi:hypothetical protein
MVGWDSISHGVDEIIFSLYQDQKIIFKYKILKMLKHPCIHHI